MVCKEIELYKQSYTLDNSNYSIKIKKILLSAPNKIILQ